MCKLNPPNVVYCPAEKYQTLHIVGDQIFVFDSTRFTVRYLSFCFRTEEFQIHVDTTSKKRRLQ